MGSENWPGEEAWKFFSDLFKRRRSRYKVPQTCTVCGKREFSVYDFWLDKTYCAEHAPKIAPETQKEPRPGRTGAGANW